MEIEEGVIFLDNLREVDNLSAIRKAYNSVVYCRKGRIMIEMGGNQQYKINPGQMLLIPTGKVIQPLMVSTDIEANALLISDQRLKLILGNQINIWNKAMYMKEIYVIDETSWVIDMGKYTKSIFKHVKCPELYDEIRDSFLRTMLLMICEELMKRWITDSVMDDCYQRLKETDMSVKEIAGELGFPNASFFGQYFREQAGMTPIAYRNKHKNVEWRK